MGKTRPWRWLAAIAVVSPSLGALDGTTVTDVDAHARERQEGDLVVGPAPTLDTDRFYLAATNYERALALQHRASLQSSVSSTLGQLATANGALTDTNDYAFLQGTSITTLQSCLGGVQNAYQQIAGNNNHQAAQDISAVSGPCLSLAGGTKRPRLSLRLPRPRRLLVGSTYFAYATNSVAGNIQIIESTDLVHWSPAGNALPQLPGWATPDATWAPGVALIGGNVLLYYAAEVAGPGGGEGCISVATATQPQGPFVDTSTAPLECQPSSGGSIDPVPFIDTNGNIYLLWKSNDAEDLVAAARFERHRFFAGLLADPAPCPRPVVGGRERRGPRHGHDRRSLLPLLLGQRLEQRQLRRRCGQLRGTARAVHRSLVTAAFGQRRGCGRSGGRVGLRRRDRGPTG